MQFHFSLGAFSYGMLIGLIAAIILTWRHNWRGK